MKRSVINLSNLIKFSCLSIGLIFTIVGCVSKEHPILIYGNIPDGAPRGYVDFYCLDKGDYNPDSSLLLLWDIYKNYDNEEIRILQRYNWLNNHLARIAEQPGKYVFIVGVGQQKEFVSVEVVEGMITPVIIEYEDFGSQYRISTTVKQYLNDTGDYKDGW